MMMNLVFSRQQVVIQDFNMLHVCAVAQVCTKYCSLKSRRRAFAQIMDCLICKLLLEQFFIQIQIQEDKLCPDSQHKTCKHGRILFYRSAKIMSREILSFRIITRSALQN
jgi:hypothetical protein